MKVNILGTNISKYNLDDTISTFEKTIKNDKKIRVCVTPVNCLIWAYHNQKLKKIYNSADLCTADGVPLIWISKLLNNPIRGRVSGIDLLSEFSNVAAKKNYSFFFLGAADGVANKLRKKLQIKYSGLDVVGTYSPPFRKKFSEKENQEMIKRINEVQPNVLWVSLTAPKQDYWIYENISKLDVNIAVGVGAAFDIIAGDIPRAPIWMQKNGLEWFFRLAKEPRRLFKRYLIEAPKFIPLSFIQIIRERLFNRNE